MNFWGHVGIKQNFSYQINTEKRRKGKLANPLIGQNYIQSITSVFVINNFLVSSLCFADDCVFSVPIFEVRKTKLHQLPQLPWTHTTLSILSYKSPPPMDSIIIQVNFISSCIDDLYQNSNSYGLPWTPPKNYLVLMSFIKTPTPMDSHGLHLKLNLY